MGIANDSSKHFRELYPQSSQIPASISAALPSPIPRPSREQLTAGILVRHSDLRAGAQGTGWSHLFLPSMSGGLPKYWTGIRGRRYGYCALAAPKLRKQFREFPWRTSRESRRGRRRMQRRISARHSPIRSRPRSTTRSPSWPNSGNSVNEQFGECLRMNPACCAGERSRRGPSDNTRRCGSLNLWSSEFIASCASLHECPKLHG